MRRLQYRMGKALKQWASMLNGMPNDNGVCHFIQALEVDATE
jgi:hypothetical protein